MYFWLTFCGTTYDHSSCNSDRAVFTYCISSTPLIPSLCSTSPTRRPYTHTFARHTDRLSLHITSQTRPPPHPSGPLPTPSAQQHARQPSRPPTTPDHLLCKTPAHSTASQPTRQPTQTPANPAVRSSLKNVPTKPPLPSSPSHHPQPQLTYPCPLSLFLDIKHSL